MTTYVTCINDRIEVDPRDPQEMRSDRGDSEICIIGPSFDFGPDATRWVEVNLRGVGGPAPSWPLAATTSSAVSAALLPDHPVTDCYLPAL
ncbi:hypothetical protein ACFW16_34035 [Inquilinus sp. NPDC058860]|uniref:hypothetical protein n=1 Tax=Inquilinus sp. NPDC058860 TaxID=3346652 RepID=UPI0036CD7E9A